MRLVVGRQCVRIARGTIMFSGLALGGISFRQFPKLLFAIAALLLGPSVATALTAFGLSLLWLSRELYHRQSGESDRFTRGKEYDLRALTDALPAVVAYIDKNERYLSMNAYVRRIGLTPEYFVGNTMAQVLPLENTRRRA